MVDGFGSKSLSRKLIDEMRGAGVHFLVYRPKISPWTFKRARLRRLHRKLAVIDARIAFVGGINIIDDEDTVHGIPPRFDYAVRVEGPLVASIYPVVKRLWKLVSATQLRSRRPETRALVPDAVPRGSQRAAVRHPRQLAPPPGNRGRLSRGDRALPVGSTDRQRVFLSRTCASGAR